MKVSPTQQRILDLLSDGAAHPVKELVACLWDDAAENPAAAVAKHIHYLRGKLARQGRDIVGRSQWGSLSYRMVRFITAGE